MRAWRSLPTGVSASIHRVLIGLYFYDVFSLGARHDHYGTGIRHHIVAIWIPVLLGVPPLLDSLSTVTSRYRGSNGGRS